jgi:hypothetical protein
VALALLSKFPKKLSGGIFVCNGLLDFVRDDVMVPVVAKGIIDIVSNSFTSLSAVIGNK